MIWGMTFEQILANFDSFGDFVALLVFVYIYYILFKKLFKELKSNH